jgi:hypothetical protein
MPAKTSAFIDEIVATYFAGKTLRLVLSTALVNAQTDQGNVLEPSGASGYARGLYVVRVLPNSRGITNDTTIDFATLASDWAPILGICLVSDTDNFFYRANLNNPLIYRTGDTPSFYPGTLTFKEL